jgi:hypothetical protein
VEGLCRSRRSARHEKERRDEARAQDIPAQPGASPRASMQTAVAPT